MVLIAWISVQYLSETVARCCSKGELFAGWAASSSLLCKLLLCDSTTRITVCKRMLLERNPFESAPSSFSLSDHIYTQCTGTGRLLMILNLYCMFKKKKKLANSYPRTSLCYIVRQKQHWNRWRKHFVLLFFRSHWGSHPQEVVMSCEMNGFYSSVILRS